jgi:AcrR family transcriptional regulator
LTVPLTKTRKVRADAQRNRDRLLEVAREAFMQFGIETSLEDIAKQAGVGSATLYRHYPTREALIEAVYARDVEKLAALGEYFLSTMPPLDALRTWMFEFIDHIAEKTIIAPALNNAAYENAALIMHTTIGGLVERAIDSKDLRSDTVPLDFLMAMIGISQMHRPDWVESAKRLIDTLLRGACRAH